MILALPFYVVAINRSRMAANTEIEFRDAVYQHQLPMDETRLKEIEDNRAQCDETKRTASILYWISMLLFIFLHSLFNFPFN